MTKTLKLTLLALFIFQLLVASGFELAHDEAYYWIFSKNLDWGYFDHPPFMAVVIGLFSFLPHGEVSVRLGFIALQFLTLLIIYQMVPRDKKNATILFFSFPLASFTGLLALPDIPLLFMTACYCWALKRYLEKDDQLSFLALGISIPVLLYAKYHGILLVFFTLIGIPELFKRKSFYLITLISIILFLPHVIWQYQHEFATLRYHFLERPAAAFSLKRSGEFLLLQTILTGLLVGPVVWWIVIKLKSPDRFHRALKFISLGSVFFFLISTFSKRVEANWTIYLAVPLIVLVASSELWSKKWIKFLLYTSLAITLMARLLLVVSPEMSGAKRAREFHGWEKWAREVRALCGDEPLLANSYQIASKLSYYLKENISALNYHSRKNQFDFWRFDQFIPSKTVCYVTDKAEFVGEPIISPDLKTLKVVKNQDLKTLWALKNELNLR